MSTIMQNIFYGTKVKNSSFTEEQLELLNDDEMLTSYYHGGCSTGSIGSFIGVEIKMLQDESIFELDKFISSFDRHEMNAKVKEVIQVLKDSETLKSPEFKDFDFDNFVAMQGDPKLLIIPETD